jgi:hypothetical protein
MASPTPPGREPRGWLSACRWREKRPSSSSRQANEVGGGIEKGLSHPVTGEPRRSLEHEISLQEVASG